jgi:Undecaprenyl-phosphate glucose phosphotransferase
MVASWDEAMQLTASTSVHNAPPARTGAAAEERISPVIVTGVVRAAELAVLAFTGFLVAAAWMGLEEPFMDSRYAAAILATSLAAVLAAQRLQLYSVATLTSPLRSSPRVLLGWSTAMALLVSTVFILKAGPDFSRGWLMLWYVTGFGSLVLFRHAASALMLNWARQGRLNRRAVIFGAGPAGETLVSAIEGDGGSDVLICGIFDDRGVDRVPDTIKSYPRLGNVDELVAFCRSATVDLLIVTLPLTAETRLLQVLKKASVLPIDIRLAAHSNKLRFQPRAYSFLGSVPLIDLFDKPLTEWDSIVKATFDKVVAAMALVLLSPLMLLTALAIKLDSKGPVLFRQKRLGFNNEVVEVFKFRSMFTDLCDANAAKLATRGDPRITRVGRVIRKTSIDELPQLFNVLLGSLSLVGPRPHALQAKAADRLYHDVVDGYFSRHKVKPGITGWAQINGWRGETDTPEKIQQRVACDLYYIENWSLLLDIFILLKTPFALLKTENAY